MCVNHLVCALSLYWIQFTFGCVSQHSGKYSCLVFYLLFPVYCVLFFVFSFAICYFSFILLYLVCFYLALNKLLASICMIVSVFVSLRIIHCLLFTIYWHICLLA